MVFTFVFSMLVRPQQALGYSSDEVQIKANVHDYFWTLYESRRSLQTSDFSQIATTTNSVNPGWIAREQERQDIERVIAQTFNESVLGFEFTLDVESVEISNNKALINLYESNTIWYSSSPNIPSQMANLKHVLTLTKVNDKWIINNDEYDNDMTRLMETLTKEEILKNIQKNHDAQFLTLPVIPSIPNAQIQPSLTSYSYSGTAAKSYADTWALNGPSSSPYYGRDLIPTTILTAYQSNFGHAYPTDSHGHQTYQRESNDCANFVSQAIFAGTNYTDGDGSYWNPTPNDSNWYYVFNPPSDKGSTSWINVAALKTYLTRTNGSRGPYGYDSGNYLCNLHNGDPILMKSSSNTWHVVMVSYFTGDCNIASNVLVDAHNTEYKQQPLSYWSGWEWHAVTISGYYK